MAQQSLILAQHLSLGIGNQPLIHQLNWQVSSGQHWVISGDRGAGKSLLLKGIQGKARVFLGSLEFPFLGKSDVNKARKSAIQLVAFTDSSRQFQGINTNHYYQQRYNAFDADGFLTVRQYLESNGFLDHEPYHMQLIDLFGLKELFDRERIKLSSGQTRKLLLIKGLISNPRILALDDPYIGLDASSRNQLNAILDELVATLPITLLIATHLGHLPKCVSHQLHLVQGAVALQKRYKPAKYNQKLSYPIPLHPLERIKSFFQKKRLDASFNKVFELSNIHVRYNKKSIFQDFNWTVGKGEKWALFGPNGAGKSTILSLIYGDHPQAYSNEIYLFDHRRGRGESIWDIKKRIGFTSPELHSFFLKKNMDAETLILSGLKDRLVGKNVIPAAAKQLLEALFSYFELEAIRHQPFQTLSTGTQRLLFFLRALIKIPPVLLLDEPFQGFDDQTITLSKALLEHILDDRYTLVFITHLKGEIPGNVKQIKELTIK